MIRSLLLAFLGPLMASAGVIVSCPTPNTGCDFLDTETAVGNTGTVEFAAGFSSTVAGTATFTLSQAFVTSGPVRFGWINLTFWSDGDYGFASSSSGSGTFAAQFGCSGSAQILTMCYNHSLQPILLGQVLPIQMQIQVSRSGIAPGFNDGGGRELFLQAQFFEVDPVNQLPGAPVQVSFVPEPGSIWLCGAGLIAAGLHRLRRSRNRFSPH